MVFKISKKIENKKTIQLSIKISNTLYTILLMEHYVVTQYDKSEDYVTIQNYVTWCSVENV